MALIQEHEGLRLHVYTDSTGHRSIGWGHNLDDGITESQAQVIFRDDVFATISFLSQYDWYQHLDNVRQAAIVDMAFDLRHAVLNFTDMIACIKNQDWAGAKAALLDSLFARQTGRRAIEDAEMLATGNWPSA